MDVDKLVEIPMSALPALKSLFRQDWPRHLIGYFIIDNYQRWFQQTPNIPNLKIYSLNGDWASDGVFLAVVSKFKIKQCFKLTLSHLFLRIVLIYSSTV